MNSDDVPVGQHKLIPMEDPNFKTSLEQADTSGPLIDRLQNSKWNTRVQAYQDLSLFLTENIENPDTLAEYKEKLTKIQTESNALVIDRILDCLLIYLPKYSDISLNIISPLIIKGLQNSKTSIKNKSLSCLVIISQKYPLEVTNEFISTISSMKNVKSVSSILQSLNNLIEKVSNLNIENILDTLVKDQFSLNNAFKADIISIIKSAHKYLGNNISKWISLLKKNLQEELSKSFEITIDKKEGSSVPSIPQNIPELDDNKKGIQISNEINSINDPLSFYNEEWCNKLFESKSWKEKKELIDNFSQGFHKMKLPKGEFHCYIIFFKRLLAENNPSITISTIQALMNLSQSFGKRFSPGLKQLFPYVMQKLKDKKTFKESFSCLKVISLISNPCDIKEELLSALNDKQPSYKIICISLCQAILTESTCLKQFEEEIIEKIIKLKEDPSNDVRKSASDCIELLNKNGKELNENNPKNEGLNIIPKEQLNLDQSHNQTNQKLQEIVEERKGEIIFNKESLSGVQSQNKKSNQDKINEESTLITEWNSIIPQEILDTFIKDGNGKGFNLLSNWINSNSMEMPKSLGQLIKFIRYKLKNWKENNIPLQIEGLKCLHSLCKKSNISQDYSMLILEASEIYLLNKKFLKDFIEVILTLSESVGPKSILNALLLKFSTSQSPLLIKGICKFFSRLISEFNMQFEMIKGIIIFMKTLIVHSNQSIRKSSLKVFISIYRKYGPNLLYTNDLKDPQKKLLEKEFSKVQQSSQPVSNRILRGEAEAEFQNEKKQLNYKVDISNSLSTIILENLTHKDWKERKKALEDLEKIIAEANNNIKNKGIGPLIGVLKERLKDSNKLIQRASLNFLNILVSAVGPGVKQYSKIIIPQLVDLLADKQFQIRSDALISLSKVAEMMSPETVISLSAVNLIQNNTDMRFGILKWIYEHKEALQKSEIKAVIIGIIATLQDKMKEIRDISEKLLQYIISFTGIQMFLNGIQDLKPAVKNSIKSIIVKYSTVPTKEELKFDCKSSSEENSSNMPIIQNEDREKMNKSALGELPPDKSQIAENFSFQELSTKIDESRRVSQPNILDHNNGKGNDLNISAITIPESNLSKMNSQISLDTSAISTRTKYIKIDKVQKNSLSPSRKNSPLKNFSNSIIQISKILINKEKRIELEKNDKWPIEEMNDQYIQKLKGQLHQIFSPWWCDLLFSFNTKKQIDSLNFLMEFFSFNLKQFIELFDLILKIAWLAMLDIKNTLLFNHTLSLFKSIIFPFQSVKYNLNEYEANFVVTLLCYKASIVSSSLKQEIRDTLQLFCAIIPPPTLVLNLMKAINLKFNKIKFESLEMILIMINNFGISIINPRDLRALSKIMNKFDNDTKQLILQIIKEIYKVKRDEIWNMVIDITENDKTFIKSTTNILKMSTETKNSTSEIIHLNGANENNISSQNNPRINSVELPLKLENLSIPIKLQNVDGINISPSKQIKNEKYQDPQLQNQIVPNKSTLEMESTPAKGINLEENNQKIKKYDLKNDKYSDDGLTQNENKEKLKQNLCVLNLSEKIKDKSESLLSIYEMINKMEQNKNLFLDLKGLIIESFTNAILKYSASKEEQEDIKFYKYLLNILHRFLSFKEFTQNLSELELKSIIESLLLGIYKENMKQQQEGFKNQLNLDNMKQNENDLSKELNNGILKILENSNFNSIIILLIKMMGNKNDPEHYIKITGFIIKCLIKLTRHLEANIDKVNLNELLIVMHEFLVEYFKPAPTVSQNDEFKIKMIKTILNELIRVLNDKILSIYNSSVALHSVKDEKLLYWIKIILKSKNPNQSVLLRPPVVPQQNAESKLSDIHKSNCCNSTSDNISNIIQGLKSAATFKDSLKKLLHYKLERLDLDLNSVLKDFPAKQKDLIINHIEKQINFLKGTELSENLENAHSQNDSNEELKISNNKYNSKGNKTNSPEKSHPSCSTEHNSNANIDQRGSLQTIMSKINSLKRQIIASNMP